MFPILTENLGSLIGATIGAFVGGALIVGLVVYFILMTKAKKARNDAKSILEDAEKKAEEVKKKAEDESRSKLDNAKQQTELIMKSASFEADKIKAQAQTDMANERIALHEKAENEAKAMKKGLDEESAKLDTREDSLDRRDSLVTAKENKLDLDLKALKEGQDKLANDLIQLQKDREEIDAEKAKEDAELARISGLSLEEAKKEVMDKVAAKSETEIAEYLRQRHEEAEDKAEQDSKNILSLAMERYAQDVAIERTTTNVILQDDELKGRIIGRQGRNIKSLESLLGCDILVDDTPNVITVSSFDPIRREIAVETLNTLIKDGRIQPGRIEDVYAKVKEDIETTIRETGEDTCMSLGLPMISRQFYPYIGRLKYRTSFGQSVLEHSKQVAYLCGIMAAELGLDQTMAKRAGLLHDIGKSVDFEVDGSHVDLGVKLAKKFGEPEIVINAIASHHGDCEKKYLISELVVAADTLSAARPGARRETLENYIKRVEDLENICKSFDGVSNCYALQSGRDLRVMVLPEKVDDATCVTLAQKIKDKIENEMTYPGYIKVTVIRETRVIETAR